MTTTNAALREWDTQTAKLTQPEHIHWCTGSDTERDELVELMLERGDLIELNQATFPNCYLHRSHEEKDARRMMDVLPQRLAQYGLSLNPSKTPCFIFGRRR